MARNAKRREAARDRRLARKAVKGSKAQAAGRVEAAGTPGAGEATYDQEHRVQDTGAGSLGAGVPQLNREQEKGDVSAVDSDYESPLLARMRGLGTAAQITRVAATRKHTAEGPVTTKIGRAHV